MLTSLTSEIVIHLLRCVIRTHTNISLVFPFSKDLGCFCLPPTIPVCLTDASQQPRSSVGAQRKRGSRAGRGEDSLSSLPYEVLCNVASFLDSLSLSQLALVSRLMRQVCSSLLQERGMVTLRWERKTYSHGGAKWRVKHKVSREPLPRDVI